MKRTSVKRQLGETETVVSFPDDFSLRDKLSAVADAWDYHSNEPPSYVKSEDESLAALVAEEFSTDKHTVKVRKGS